MVGNIRNIGIIAHVDHGKTTLVDRLLEEAGAFQAHENIAERVMDSMDLEREKGITIRAKNASIRWQELTVNIVDTPGHADFGGEVERILQMVDGVLLLVDAAEGPQAQTRFVLRKALAQHLPLIVVINKVDRDHADPVGVHDAVLELLLELHASEDQFDAPFLYGSARDGFMSIRPHDLTPGFGPLFEAVRRHIPPPKADPDGPFRMLISNLDWSDYVGRIAIGKIESGSVTVGDMVTCLHRDGKPPSTSKITKVYSFAGLASKESNTASAGDIVRLAGIEEPFIGETLCDNPGCKPIAFSEIDPPTIQMHFCVNDGPFAGRDGEFLTARHLRERLVRETRTNISLEVSDTTRGDVFLVSARGELQIAVVAETMRREGYEMLISRPEVITREKSGKTLEPFEDLWIEIPDDRVGDTIQALVARKGEMTHLEHRGEMAALEASIPTRGLIGFEGYLTNLTSGRSMVSHLFREYAPWCGEIPSRTNGALVAAESGIATGYALNTLQERGKLFIAPQANVYPGMIVGEHARSPDLPCNPTRTKQLTNVRASGADKAIQLEPPLEMNLEKSLEWIAADEYVEATPAHLRLRKKILNANLRKRSENVAKQRDLAS